MRHKAYKLLIRLLSLFILPPWRGKAFRDCRLKSDPFPGFAKTVAVLPYLKSTIDTVVIGSSHAHYGYNAEGNVFNFGYTSCDLYHALGVYRWLDANGFSKIKNIILFFDVFSPGFMLEKTSESYLHIPFEENFGIRARCQLARVSETKVRILKRMCHYFACKARKNPVFEWRGNGDHTIVIFDDVKHRVEGHLKNCFRGNNQIQYVEDVFKLATQRGDELLIVIPPLRADYREFLPPSETVFRELYALAEKEPQLKIINLQDDLRFADADFNDMDHLNLNGAKKLTKIIEHMIKDGD